MSDYYNYAFTCYTTNKLHNYLSESRGNCNKFSYIFTVDIMCTFIRKLNKNAYKWIIYKYLVFGGEGVQRLRYNCKE